MFKVMFHNVISLCLIVFASLVPLHAGAVTIFSTFDADTEGWTGNPGEGAISWHSAGGNPGGHIRFTDIGVGGVPFGSGGFAGPAFHGDLTAFDGGTLSFDMATIIGGGGTFPRFGEVLIFGGGDVATVDLATSAPIGWQHFATPLTAAVWGKTQLEWAAILADVTDIGLATDAFDGADTIGIDNFYVTSPSQVVPVPPALAMLASTIVLTLLGSRLHLS